VGQPALRLVEEEPDAKSRMWSSLQEAWATIRDVREELRLTRIRLAKAQNTRDRHKEELADTRQLLKYAQLQLASRESRLKKQIEKEQLAREQRLEDLTGY
jgi:hypothetical protein